MQSGNIADGNGKDRISAPNQQLTVYKSMLQLESLFDFSLYGSSPDGEPASAAPQPIRTFKAVLAAGSKYFRTLFTNDNFSDSQSNGHTSDIFSHECLKAVVEFLHEGDVHAKNAQFPIDLLKAARYYQVDDLVSACETYLVSHLEVDNSIDLWKFACQHEWTSTFVADIEKFIAKNLKKVVTDRNFLALKAEGICNLLSIKPIVTSVSADMCLQAALAWLENDPTNRKVSSEAVLHSTPLCPGMVSRQVLFDACRSKAMSPFAKEKLLDLSAYNLDLDYNEFISVPDYAEPSLGVSTSSSIKNLYFVGGKPKECRKQFLQYNVNRKEWVQLDPLPWSRYAGSAGVFDGDRLLVFGGEKGEAVTADVDEFSFSSSTWSKVSALPVAWYGSACGSQKHAYLTSSNSDSKLIQYSASTKKGVFKEDMLCKRCWHSASFSANLNAVFVADGFSGDGNNTKFYPRIDKYDVANDMWKSVGFVKVKCYARASVLCGDELYLTGGYDRTKYAAIGKVEVCNVRTGKVWSVPDLPAPRWGCQAALLYNNVICVFGYSESVAAYDMREGKWTTGIVVPDMPVRNTHFGFAWK